MNLTRNLGLGAILAAGLLPATAQSVKISGDAQLWFTQMLDNNLRLNSKAGKGYYNLRSEFQENMFGIRRIELKASGKITEEVEYEVMFDPSIATGTSNPSILQDAAITWKVADSLSLRMGQFKNMQTLEGLTSSTEILFAERSQLGRVFGDKRDRGVVLTYAFGDPKEFGAKLSLGAFNGMGDAISGKGADTNAQKDAILRLDLNYGREHRFGFYTLQGMTDVADKTGQAIAPAAPPSGWPSQADIYASKDATSNVGAFYAFQNSVWHFSAEALSGTLGRRNPTLGATPSIKRDHLDQKLMGFYVTGGYTTGNHSFLLRYDAMNYNSGDKWYGTSNPYLVTANGAAADYTPKFTEITAGYTYAFIPEKVKAANIKLNYIARSKNFLAPRAGQTGEQGGDTLVAAFLVAF
jgi:hypothetical protein